MKNKLLIALVLVMALGGIVALSVQKPSNSNSMVESPQNNDAEETVSVSTIVNNGSIQQTYSSEVTSGSTAIDVLLNVAETNGFEVKTTEYDFGILVDSIDGTAGNAASNTYWIYYVNDASATVGASSYKVVEGDSILWKFEKAL